MWYLQGDTFILLAAFSLLAGLLRRLCPNKIYSVVLPLAETAALWYISRRLCLLYIAYCLMGIVCAQLLRRHPKKLLFLLFSLLALVPFFLSRSAVFGFELPFLFVSIGISFAMLRLIDCYYYVYYTHLDLDPLVFVNYMLLLPVFTAGPIFRYRDFIKTHAEPLPLDAPALTYCFKRLVRGMFKKVVLAALAMQVMERLLGMSSHWYVSLVTVICSYALLYLDLSGYSDIAIAFGRLAGYSVPENFKSPLASPSFTQFWRSWHATLSDWIREHVFILLGKRRLNRWISAAISVCTMVLMSLWHGFNLPYLMAGLYNGALLALESLFSLTTVNKRKTPKSIFLLRCLAVNFLFALNTLVFTVPADRVLGILRGFFRI